MTRAAILRTLRSNLTVEEIDVDAPKAGEVRIRLSASGLCHSDLALINGAFPLPLPALAGHEGAGVVEAVGPGVSRVVPGDAVILSAIPQCGRCFWCRRGQATNCEVRTRVPSPGGQLDGTTRLHCRGEDVAQYCFAGTFAEMTVAPEICVVKIPSDSNMVVAALVGCAVTTGVGAARNTADIHRGDTVAVVGCGGVGLNVIQGARSAGAGRVIAIDIADMKLGLARRFGATDIVDGRIVDVVEAVRKLTSGRGADVAFEVTGTTKAATQVLEMTRRGGEMVFIGVAPPESVLPVRLLQASGKVAKGCQYGQAHSQTAFPQLLSEYADGLLELDLLVSNTISLDQVNEGFADMQRGAVARSVIVHG